MCDDGSVTIDQNSPPSGTVTFLFTDIEGSTRLWEEHSSEMENALERHDQILRSVLEGYGGYVFSTAGDAFAAAFSRVGDAVDAAMEAQSQLGSEPWPPLAPIRVRMGLHTGEAQERGGDYFGAAVNRAARIMSAGHGGQILASSVSAPMVEDVNFVDSGEHRLKDLAVPEHLFQVGVGQFPALRTLDQVPHNLPRLRTELVGREQQLSELSERISTNRLVTVAGVGGMGKTTIAVAAAARVADKFPDGVWFVDLAPVSGEGRVASAVAQAAGLRLDGAGDSAVRLGELIGDRRLLVVMDNCEHLIDEVAEVVDTILELSSDAHVLATSRERLDLDGEQLVVLDPLEAHGPDAAAVQLLQERASSIGVDLAGADPELLRRLCDGLDGMPLALELAAANLTHLSLEEMIEQLSSRFDLLETSGRGRRRGRQSSLLHVLSSSWDLLDPASQQMLTRLAVFPARFDAAAAIAVSADLANPSRSLRRLVDSSLIDVASTTGSGLRLLESVKQFALEHWEGDTALHRDHHLMWVHDHLVEASLEQRLLAGSQMADFFNHVEDFRAAINHATETAELDLAADLVMAGGYCSRMRSGAAAVEQHFGRLGAGLDPQVRPLHRRAQIGPPGAASAAVFLGRLHVAKAFLFGAVVVVVARIADLDPGLDQRVGNRKPLVRTDDIQRPADAVKRGRRPLQILGLLEVRQHLVVGPSTVAHLRPAVVVGGLATHIKHRVDRARPTQHAAARHRNFAIEQVRLGFGVEQPINGGIDHRLDVADRHMDPRVPIVAAGLEQQHRDLRILAQPRRQHAAGRAGADDDVIVGRRVGGGGVIHGWFSSCFVTFQAF